MFKKIVIQPALLRQQNTTNTERASYECHLMSKFEFILRRKKLDCLKGKFIYRFFYTFV